MNVEIPVPLQNATEVGEQPPWSVTPPELVQAVNFLPDEASGALAVRPDLADARHQATVDGFYGMGYDALGAVAVVPASGVPVNATASGPRDAMGASLGEVARISGELRGRIFRCRTCIFDKVRPGYYARIQGEARLFEVARLLSAFACELDEAPTLQGQTTIDFVAGWGKEPGRLGIATDIIGATLVIGPNSPAAAYPVRYGGPLLADVEEKGTGSIMSWQTAVVPRWPEDFDPLSVSGLAYWRGRLYILWGENAIASSLDGGRSWVRLGRLPWGSVTSIWAAANKLFAAVERAVFKCTGGDPLDPGAWTLFYDAGEPILEAFALGAVPGVPALSVVVSESEWSTETDDFYSATVALVDSEGSVVLRATVPSGLLSPGNRVLAVDAARHHNGTYRVFVLTELGELHVLKSDGTWQRRPAGGVNEERNATRPYRTAGATVTTVAVSQATPTLPKFLSATYDAAAIVLEDIRTIVATGSQNPPLLPGLYAFQRAEDISTSDTSPDPIGAEPVGRVHHLECAGRYFTAWVDWRGQFWCEMARIEQLANPLTTSVVIDGGSPVVTDRGIGLLTTSAARPCGKVLARGFTGAERAFLDADGVVTRLAGNGTARVANRCVAAAGGPDVIAFADGTAIWLLAPDFSLTDISASFPDPSSVGLGTASGSHLFLGARPRSEIYASPLSGGPWTTISVGGQIVGIYGAADGCLLVTDDAATYYDTSLTPTGVPLPAEAVLPLTGGGALGSGQVAVVDAEGTIFTGPLAGPLTRLGFAAQGTTVFRDEGTGVLAFAAPGLPAPFLANSGWLSFFSSSTSSYSHQSGKSVSFLGLPLWIGEAGKLRLVDLGQRRGDAAVTDGEVVASVTAQGCAEVVGASRGLAVLSPPIFPGAALDGGGSLIFSDQSGQIFRLAQDSSVTAVVSLSSGPIYVGGDGPAFAVSANDLAVVSATHAITVGLLSAKSAAAAGNFCSVLEEENLAIVASDGYTERRPLGEHAGIAGTVPVAARQTPMILVPTGVQRRRGSPDVQYKLYALRGWDWRLLGSVGSFAAPLSAVGAHGRITLMAERILDVSSWGGGFFTPASRDFWSPVWATADGMLVLFGTTEIEDGKIIHYRRRVRWSAPLAPRDFETLEASGLAELYPDTGEFLAACGLSHAIIYADEGGLGVLEPTGQPEAPWSHRRIAEGIVPATPMVRVGGSAMFIAKDGGLWVANPAGAQRVQGRVPILKYVYELDRIGLCALPRLGLLAAWSPGHRFANLIDMRTGRTTTLVHCPDTRWESTIQAIADGSPVGEDLLISYSWLNPAEIPLASFSTTYYGVDHIQGHSLPWFAALVTGVVPPTAEGGFTPALVRLEGSGLEPAEIWADVIESSHYPRVSGIPATLDADSGLLIAGAPIGHKVPAERNTGTLRLARPWWAEGTAILDGSGAPVQFTPLDDLTVAVPAGIDLYIALLPEYTRFAVVRADTDVIAPAGTALVLDPWTASPETGYPFPWTQDVLLLPLRWGSYGRIAAAGGAPRAGRGHVVAVALRPDGLRIVLTGLRVVGAAGAWRQQTA